MATPVIMPKFGMAQEVGVVVEWLKNEGDTVEKGETLLNTETDKVVMEVEAPASGVLAGIRAEPEETVPVTEIIAWILAPDESLPSEASQPPAWRAGEVAPSKAKADDQSVTATPVARRMAEAAGLELSELATADGQRITRADVEARLDRQESDPVPGKVRATPAARRLARERGLDLEAVPGSGPRGRIQAADVASYAPPETEAAPEPEAEVIPLQGMRQTIARRMQQSAQEAPHVTFTLDIDMSQAQALRTQLQALAEPELKVSMTALLAKAAAWSLMRHRAMNARLVDNEIRRLSQAHIGVAVALEEGLIVPVVRQAEAKGVLALAAELNDLTARARENRLTPDEVSDGSFTLSNLGMFGIDQFTAIINPPETGILAVGRIARRVVVPDDSDEPLVRPMMTVTLSADHRVIDGAVAARFLADFKRVLEEPALLVA